MSLDLSSGPDFFLYPLQIVRHAVKEHKAKPCFGIREVKSEENEVQPNGKVFKKVMTILLYIPPISTFFFLTYALMLSV